LYPPLSIQVAQRRWLRQRELRFIPHRYRLAQQFLLADRVQIDHVDRLEAEAATAFFC
jgi:hypothetical protein